jgi:phospholipid/cholesterol/gamma-HCH transport system substrate-binding protein
MESRAAIKVGVVVLVGFALFYAGWYFLAHMNLNSYKLRAVFRDTKGLQRQTPLRMNGVTIGEVKSVDLDPGSLMPVVSLSVDNKYRIPRNSRIQITSGLLISNPQIEIIPGNTGTYYADGEKWDDPFVQKMPASGLAAMSPEADVAIKHLSHSLEVLDKKLPATLASLQGILKRTDRMMVNFEQASYSAKSLAGDPKIRNTMYALMDDMKAVSANARLTAKELTGELRVVVKRNSAKVDELTTGAVDLLQKFADTVDAARGAVTKLAEQVSDPRLQQSLVETLDLAKTTLARFNQIASDIHNLSGDPNVQNDLKTTVSTFKETAEEGQKLVERINSLVGNIKTGGTNPFSGIGRPQLAIDFMGRTNAPHFRSDVNVRLPIGQKNAFNLGIFDFAERYKLNAQYETILGGYGSLRYGVYAGKLGAGWDWPAAVGSTHFRLDMYNPNDLQLDAKAYFKINEDFSLFMGADSLFKRTTPTIGVRLAR